MGCDVTRDDVARVASWLDAQATEYEKAPMMLGEQPGHRAAVVRQYREAADFVRGAAWFAPPRPLSRLLNFLRAA